MTDSTFKSQMTRLQNRFGKQIYGDELVKLMYREFKDESDLWFETVVDYFIGNSRQAPLVNEFKDKQIDERERNWNTQKKKNAKEEREWFEYMPLKKEEAHFLTGGICQLLKGIMTEEDKNAYNKLTQSFLGSRRANAFAKEQES